MKIDFNMELKTIRGAPLMERVVTDEVPDGTLEVITLGSCAVGALLNPEQGVSGKEKAKRYALAIRIQERAEPELELSVDQVSTVKGLIGKSFNALMVGQCWEMLDPTPKEPAATKA